MIVRTALVALVVVLAVSNVACGSGDSSSSGIARADNAGIRCGSQTCGANQACCAWDNEIPRCGSVLPDPPSDDPCVFVKGMFYANCDGQEDCAADENCLYNVANWSYGFACTKKSDGVYEGQYIACHSKEECPLDKQCSAMDLGYFFGCK